MILGTEYKEFADALCSLELERLSSRREMLCINFAKKAIKSEKYKIWFAANEKLTNIDTRSDKLILKPVKKPGQKCTKISHTIPYYIAK